MSSSSVGGKIWHSATHLSDWKSLGANPLFSDLLGKPPEMVQTSPQPSPQQATMSALDAQLKNEVSMRQQSTLGGLAQPGFKGQNTFTPPPKVQTASQILLGGFGGARV